MKINKNVEKFSGLEFQQPVLLDAEAVKSRFFRNRNGSINYAALLLYFDYVYWFRPRENLDSRGVIIDSTPKFEGDMLWRNYSLSADKIGIPKRSVKIACDFLVAKKLIKREFRSFWYKNRQKIRTYRSNAVFIDLDYEMFTRVVSEVYSLPEKPPKIMSGNVFENPFFFADSGSKMVSSRRKNEVNLLNNL